MNLFAWTIFLPDGFENGIIQRFLTGDYKAWGSLSLFAGFLEKENSLGTLIVILENVSPKGFFWLNINDVEISVLKTNSRYLQTAALKHVQAFSEGVCDGCARTPPQALEVHFFVDQLYKIKWLNSIYFEL